MYDISFELSWRDNREPDEDKFKTLLSIGCDDAEAAEILDIEFLTFDEWVGMYGNEEEVSPENYSTLVII